MPGVLGWYNIQDLIGTDKNKTSALYFFYWQFKTKGKMKS